MGFMESDMVDFSEFFRDWMVNATTSTGAMPTARYSRWRFVAESVGMGTRHKPLSEVLPVRPSPPLKIGISACLVGEKVRYDGNHERDELPHAELDGLYDFEPICPEVGIGLGVPRPTIRLIGTARNPDAISADAGVGDVTRRLRGYAEYKADRINTFDGYLFMRGSPSCGTRAVKVHADGDSQPMRIGMGVYARAIMEARPLLPVEDGSRLFDPEVRESFIIRTFVHAHWRTLRERGLTAERLIAFHSAHKYLLMAHDIRAYRSLGRLLANLKGRLDAAADEYIAGLMAALARPASRGGHANVLSHLQGYAKTAMPARARRELADQIERYRRGEAALAEPIAVLRRHLTDADARYALDQMYLEAHGGLAKRG